MGMFHRMVQEKAYDRFNTLIVGLKGQAARATRRFIKRVNEELHLPVYICNDGDPWGIPYCTGNYFWQCKTGSR